MFLHARPQYLPTAPSLLMARYIEIWPYTLVTINVARGACSLFFEKIKNTILIFQKTEIKSKYGQC
jgi:hypothetical protein